MEEIPVSAGLQIINAEIMMNGGTRYWRTSSASVESINAIELAISQANEPRH